MPCSARRSPTLSACRTIPRVSLPPTAWRSASGSTIRMARRAAAAKPHDLRQTITESIEELGPGLVTGAADDDPSGIATYSQAGAQFGYGLLWTMVLTYPLMSAIQLVSAHIGRVTGVGLANNLVRAFPK